MLTGIIFVLRTEIPWEDLPKEMGCGCGMTCWRRLRDWQEAGVWDDIHQMFLNHLRAADKLDWSWRTVDSSSVLVVFGGDQIGPNPTDRGKSGTKHHILVDGQGTPMAKAFTGANAADVTQLIPLVDTVPPVTGRPGRPRRRLQSLWADKAYDSPRPSGGPVGTRH